MTVLKIVPFEEKPKPATTQWSLGLAMFAAFVIPFLLLLSSTRYRDFLLHAKARLEATQQQASSVLQGPDIDWPIPNHD
jgi:hypothetical protein